MPAIKKPRVIPIASENELARAELRKLLGPLDPAQRYTVNEASAYLRVGRNGVYNLINAGELPVIREGGRTFLPGAAIAARCAVPTVETRRATSA